MVVGTEWIGASLSLLYFRIGSSVSFLLHVSFQLVMRKWTTSTSNVFSYARVLDWCVVQLVHAWYRFHYNGWILKHVPKQECSQLSGYVLIGL